MSKTTVFGLGLALGLGIFALTAPGAHAQTPPAKSSGFAVDRFDPSERGSEWFVLDSLDLRGKVRPALGVVGEYAWKPLVFYDADGKEVRALIKSQTFVHVGVSLVLVDRLRLAVNLPIGVTDGNSGVLNGTQFTATDGASVGDLRFSADLRLFGEYGDAITMALGASVYAPTGDQNAYTGDGKVRLSPHLALAGDLGPFIYAARLGFNYRPQAGAFAGSAIGSEFFWALSAGFRVANKRLVIGPEIYGSTVVENGGARHGSPVEGLLGLHYLLPGDFRIGAGAGPGLNKGFGSPSARVVASLEWAPQIEPPPPPPPPPPGDRDHDGIIDPEDACPDEPGVRSTDPKKNGCPLRDRDGDHIYDDDDACPDEPGVRSSDPAKNGCPIHDRDGDGILDDDDACPDLAGPPDEDPKKNGCPDTDDDGIIDPVDACPTIPGPPNEDPKKNGCPAARIEKGQIRILEQVQFAFGSDRILHQSDTILTAVLKIVEEHPNITKISIEGHTDNKGSAKYNKNLSQRRAASVRTWLVQHGVDDGRLVSSGYGFERPLSDNATEEGRQENRRVEFHIVEINGKPADANSDATESDTTSSDSNSSDSTSSDDGLGDQESE